MSLWPLYSSSQSHFALDGPGRDSPRPIVSYAGGRCRRSPQESTMTRQTIDSPTRQERRLKMNYDEYLALVDDSTHSEWVDGEVTIFMPPKIAHMELVVFLVRLLGGFSERLKLGKVFVAPT